jgi:tRNA-2-methylthio-N6-dimethylallyladenosine synthase
VQSGSDRILGLMNRNYTRNDYLSRIDAIRSAMPDADITTDAMVGFPGETDEEFLETLSLFSAVRFTTAFMFAYSRREGTVAAAMPDDVPAQVKKERLGALIGLQTAITRERYAEMVGRKVEALFTERQGAGERLWMGRDGGAKRILLSCDENIAGTILQVQARRSSGMTLVCERR